MDESQQICGRNRCVTLVRQRADLAPLAPCGSIVTSTGPSHENDAASGRREGSRAALCDGRAWPHTAAHGRTRPRGALESARVSVADTKRTRDRIWKCHQRDGTRIRQRIYHTNQVRQAGAPRACVRARVGAAKRVRAHGPRGSGRCAPWRVRSPGSRAGATPDARSSSHSPGFRRRAWSASCARGPGPSRLPPRGAGRRGAVRRCAQAGYAAGLAHGRREEPMG